MFIFFKKQHFKIIKNDSFTISIVYIHHILFSVVWCNPVKSFFSDSWTAVSYFVPFLTFVSCSCVRSLSKNPKDGWCEIQRSMGHSFKKIILRRKNSVFISGAEFALFSIATSYHNQHLVGQLPTGRIWIS